MSYFVEFLGLLDQVEKELETHTYVSHPVMLKEGSWSIYGVLEKTSRELAISVRLGSQSAV